MKDLIVDLMMNSVSVVDRLVVSIVDHGLVKTKHTVQLNGTEEVSLTAPS